MQCFYVSLLIHISCLNSTKVWEECEIMMLKQQADVRCIHILGLESFGFGL
jgi:myo-inositol catabolism protein IolC